VVHLKNEKKILKEMIEKILNTQNINSPSNLNGDNFKQKIEDIFVK